MPRSSMPEPLLLQRLPEGCSTIPVSLRTDCSTGSQAGRRPAPSSRQSPPRRLQLGGRPARSILKLNMNIGSISPSATGSSFVAGSCINVLQPALMLSEPLTAYNRYNSSINSSYRCYRLRAMVKGG
jgi:hypothetical protein